MRERMKLSGGALLLIGGLVLVGIIVFVFIAPAWKHPPVTAQVLDAARARWKARPFDHYRLTVQYDGGIVGMSCLKDAEIRDERIVTVTQSTCTNGMYMPAFFTIAELFAQMEYDIATYDGQCGPNGCACDGDYRLEAAFEPTLGYPQKFQVALLPDERAAPWPLRLFTRCTYIGSFGPDLGQTRVIAVTPLP